MRTFVALNLPSDGRQRLHDALAPLRDAPHPVRWTAADGIHLTLKFLGEIEGSEVEPLGRVLRQVAGRHRALELRIGGLGAFPSLRRASVLWVGVVADDALAALQRDLELGLARLGYPREQRPFRPHLTVARTRGGARPPDVERLATAFDFGAVVAVDTVDLMRSHLGGAGASYEALLRAPLGKESEP